MEKDEVIAIRMELIENDGRPLRAKRDLSLAGAGRGIIRDALVPQDMTLAGLHLFIQKAFGWQDLYLHEFRLRDETFDGLTQRKEQLVLRLAGTLFRTPVDDKLSLYGPGAGTGQYIRAAGLSAGTGPVKPADGLMTEDSFYLNRMRAENYREELELARTGRRARAGRIRDLRDFNVLLERLSLRELFCAGHESSYDAVRREALKAAGEGEDRFRAFHDLDPEGYAAYRKKVGRYLSCREDYLLLREVMAGAGGDISGKEGGFDPGRIMPQYERELEEMATELRKLECGLEPELRLGLKEIIYMYDHGDRWQLRLGPLPLRYESREALRGETLVRESAAGYRAEPAQGSESSELPRLIYSDGPDLRDDMGGVDGFFRYLRALKGTGTRQDKHLLEIGSLCGWYQRSGVRA